MKLRKVAGTVALTLVIGFLLTACSNTEFVSSEPTPYTISLSNTSIGKQDVVYLEAEHPDVIAVIALSEQFVPIDRTQDYRSPDWSGLESLATADLIRSRENVEAGLLTRESIVAQAEDCTVSRIVFLSQDNKAFQAEVTADLNVMYTSVSERYAALKKISLNESASLVATLAVQKRGDTWLVTQEEYHYVNR